MHRNVIASIAVCVLNVFTTLETASASPILDALKGKNEAQLKAEGLSKVPTSFVKLTKMELMEDEEANIAKVVPQEKITPPDGGKYYDITMRRQPLGVFAAKVGRLNPVGYEATVRIQEHPDGRMEVAPNQFNNKGWLKFGLTTADLPGFLEKWVQGKSQATKSK